MRAREFITESGLTGSITPEVEQTLPSTYVIPDLKNSDFYLQYRFGVALAGAKGAEQRNKDNVPDYNRESAWGENQVVVAYAGEGIEEKFIDDALKQMGMSPTAKKQISSGKSQEPTTTNKKSLLKPFKGYE